MTTKHSHAPDNYICPICLGVQGIENEHTLICSQDIVYKDSQVMVFVASYFIKTCEGHLIVVPTKHYENLYDLPEDIGSKIFATAKKFALIMRQAYGCQGVTTLQNNEPAGGQHAFHYHMHLFPRYENDQLYTFMNHKQETTLADRKPFVEKLLTELAINP